MKEAGLFRVLQPRRWGGYELGQRAFAEVQMALANMGRIYRNMLTARQHAASQYRIYGRTFGDLLMGGEPFDMML